MYEKWKINNNLWGDVTIETHIKIPLWDKIALTRFKILCK